MASLLTHYPLEKKMKSSTPTSPPPIKVKLEAAHSLFLDGAYKRVIDKAAIGMVVYDPFGIKIYFHGRVLESLHSNNEAKYQDLIARLEWCVDNNVNRLSVYGYFLLLTKQINRT